MHKVLIFCLLMPGNVPFANNLFSMWDTNNSSLTFCGLLYIGLCNAWSIRTKLPLFLTTKPPLVNDSYMVGNVSGKALQTTDLKVYRWPSLMIYLIECKAKRNCFVDGGQVKIPITFTECSGKVAQDWSCTVNKHIPILKCWTFFAALLYWVDLI